MKTQLIFLLFSFSIAAQSFGQDISKVKFEKVSEEEMKMTAYELDTTAEAVILYDDGMSYVKYDINDGFMLTYERFVRIKILKQKGTEWGNFSIPIYSSVQSKEEIGLVKGTTFNFEKGKVVKTEMKKESIFRERENKYWEMVRFSLPSVKVGSVIDLKYTITSPLLWNLRSWKFQYLIPVKWSQYEVVYPEYFTYNHSSFGYHRLNSQNKTTSQENISYSTHTTKSNGGASSTQTKLENNSISYLTNIYKYSCKDVPAMKDEPFVTTLDNYTTMLKFELASTNYTNIGGAYKSYTNSWNDIVEELLKDEDFGGQIKSANYAKEVITSITTGKIDEKAKLLAIHNYIQHNIKWDGINSYMPSKTLRKTFNDKTGTSTEINLLLVAMLTEAGIQAYPVILSTRANGFLSPVHASLSDCNYVIARATINGTPILLDATEPNLPAGLLPYRCLNGNGVLIKTDSPEEIELTNVPSGSNTMATLEIKQGKLIGKILTKLTGLDAFDFRQEIKKAGGQEAQFKLLKEKAEGIEYLNYSYSKIDSLYSDVNKAYDVNIESNGDEEASILYVYPMPTKRMTKNPFTTLTREYPVDFGVPYTETYKLNLAIPDGYQVEELPKSKSIALADKTGIFTYQIAQMNQRVVLNMRFSILKSLFLPTEYKDLKDFFDLIVAKEAEQIVFKKIVTP